MRVSRYFALAVLISAPGMQVLGDDSKGTNATDPAPSSPTSTAVESLHTAASLVRYGDANKDAFSLITAARIMQQVGSSPSRAEAVQPSPGENKPNTLSIDAVLVRARQYASGRPDLLGLADDVAKSRSRGAADGPGFRTTVVNRRATDTFRVVFTKGEPATVAVSGDRDSDLDLYVLDENGSQICKDDDYTDQMICRWTPRWTGQFTIRIVNRGIANRYTIVHN